MAFLNSPGDDLCSGFEGISMMRIASMYYKLNILAFLYNLCPFVNLTFEGSSLLLSLGWIPQKPMIATLKKKHNTSMCMHM
jgi:hypothetical protein